MLIGVIEKIVDLDNYFTSWKAYNECIDANSLRLFEGDLEKLKTAFCEYFDIVSYHPNYSLELDNECVAIHKAAITISHKSETFMFVFCISSQLDVQIPYTDTDSLCSQFYSLLKQMAESYPAAQDAA